MLFGKKLKLIKKPDKEAEEKLRSEIEANGGLEKNDFLAMALSAFLVIFLPILLGLALIMLILFLLF